MAEPQDASSPAADPPAATGAAGTGDTGIGGDRLPARVRAATVRAAAGGTGGISGTGDTAEAAPRERVGGELDDEYLDMVRRIEAHPANAPGSDKTWVLAGMRRIQGLFRANHAIHGGPSLDELRRTRDMVDEYLRTKRD